jgi:hypothetical protein
MGPCTDAASRMLPFKRDMSVISDVANWPVQAVSLSKAPTTSSSLAAACPAADIGAEFQAVRIKNFLLVSRHRNFPSLRTPPRATSLT